MDQPGGRWRDGAGSRDQGAAPPAAAVLAQVKPLLEGSVDAAIVLDPDRRILYFNHAYQLASGRPARALQQAVEERRRCYEVFALEICEQACLGCRARDAGKTLRMHEIRAARGDEEQTFIVTAAPLAGGYLVETYRDVTADVRIQRKYRALLDRERHAKEILERTVEERTVELSAANEELRRTQAQLIHQEKMSSLGRLVAGIAHELNNPINFVYGNVDFLEQYAEELVQLVEAYDAVTPPEARPDIEARRQAIDYGFLVGDLRKLLRSVKAGAERTAGIVRDLKAFSRQTSGERSEVDLCAGIDTSLNLLAPLLKNRITVRRDYEQPTPRIVGNGGHLNQVFMNILTNAAQAIDGEGEIGIRVRRATSDVVEVEIRDSGPGIDPAIVDQIFEPFFTTKEVGEGTGLGLAISESIVRAHGGTIRCETGGGRGAAFVVSLPIEGRSEG